MLRPFLVDLVGASVAGVAMLWQIFSIFAGATKLCTVNASQPSEPVPFLVKDIVLTSRSAPDT